MKPISVSKIADLKGHSGAVYTLEKSESETLIFSGSSDKFVTCWNLEKKEAENFAAQFPHIVYSLKFISEKQILLAGTSSGTLHIIDLTQKKEIKVLVVLVVPPVLKVLKVLKDFKVSRV